MSTKAAATVRSRYVAQAASDLEENRSRQHELAEQLRALRQEEELLVEIMTLAERYQAGAEPSPLPERAPGESALTREGPHTKSAAPAGRSPRLFLGDLLIDLLSGHSRPCTARDLRAELLAQHPDREPTPQVVRNTLESLVAKGRLRRHKEQRSVSYTVVVPEG